MHKRLLTILSLLVVATVCISGCSTTPAPAASPAPAPAAPSSGTPIPAAAGTLTLQVDSLATGSVLPDRYTCKGASESPGISWDGIPEGTKSLVMILDDPDAPSGTFTHWILYNIPPQKGSLDSAQSNAKVLGNGAQQGDTTAGSRGYYPPCPPIGTTHRYIFRLYAVDMEITQPTADRESIDWALNGHTIAKTEVMTKLTR